MKKKEGIKVLRIEIDEQLYTKWIRLVKEKHRLLMGTNNLLFENAVRNALKEMEISADNNNR